MRIEVASRQAATCGALHIMHAKVHFKRSMYGIRTSIRTGSTLIFANFIVERRRGVKALLLLWPTSCKLRVMSM